MNKEEIIKILNKYNFDCDKYMIISSAALVLYGIKEKTKDIDIAVTKEYCDYLLKNFDCIFERVNEGNNVYYIDNIINFAINYYNKEESIIFENLPIQKIDSIKKLKEKLHREKDIKDIKLIEKYLKSNVKK